MDIGSTAGEPLRARAVNLPGAHAQPYNFIPGLPPQTNMPAVAAEGFRVQPDNEHAGDDSESDGQNDQPLIEDPSEDIRTDLENVLKSDLKFEGSFYFNKTYTDAPNPVLRLNTLDRIGLPLSQREAKHIAANSKQAPFGMGERTLVDTTVRDTWEMDATEVSFDNPAWKIFIDRVVQEVCAKLGVNIAASRPRCELYKLLLYETGSHFLPHQDTEKVDGMFATIVVILPSPFIGGSAHLSHAGQTAVIDQSKDSWLNTSVMAWYTDVMHEIKPIQSGYRLALSYNLIHTTTSLRPALSDTSGPIRQLRHILLSWRQNLYAEGSPQKIIYLLEHRYSEANCTGSAMKGKDAHVVAILDSISQELKFQLGLALVECHLSGGANDMGGGGWGRRDSDYDEDEDDDDDCHDDSLSIVEVDEKSMTITELVSLDGKSLNRDMVLTEEDEEGGGVEFIPADLRERVESGPIDEQEYEGYQGNYGGTLERWYRRTVLILWPAERDEEIDYGPQYAEYVLDKLESTSSSKPTKSESFSSVQSVCRAACHWNALDLWCRAMEAFCASVSVDRLGKEQYLDAILRFSPDVIVPWVHKVREKDHSNKTRLKFLDFLAENLEAEDLPSEWVEATRRSVLSSLRPLAVTDCAAILGAAGTLGGITVLETTILPQLKKGVESEPLLAMTMAVHDGLGNPEGPLFHSEQNQIIGSRIATELLAVSIERAKFFEPRPPASAPQPAIPTYMSYRIPEPWKPNPELAVSLIKACFTTANEPLIEQIVTKLISIESTGTTVEPQIRAESVLIPLVAQIREFMQSRAQDADLPSGIKRLYKEFSGVARTLPTTKAFICQLGALGREVPSAEAPLRPVITQMIRQMIRSLPSTAYQGQSQIIELLDFCADNNNIDCCGELIGRVVQDASTSTAQRLSSEFIPLLNQLTSWLSRRRKQHTWDTFPLLFKTTILAWINRVLGTTKPADVAQQLAATRNCRCPCSYCTTAIRWLTTSNQPRTRIERIGAVNVKHLEAKLWQYASNVVTSSVIRTSPQGIEIIKKDAIYKAQLWAENQAKGISAVRAISTNESVLLAIFGDREYRTVLRALNVAYINTPLPSSFAPVPTPAPVVNPPTQATTSSSTTRSSAAAAPLAHPPPKRRRVEDNVQVIDLTSP
ncbi:hypothetical protein FRC04_005433 [Tulasnella sp. 424]|nr:hypothetical protein FRC04_005433 [Tulasnella sp. 424]